MSRNAEQGFPPMRRVLVLRVRGDGMVRAMRIAMRGDRLTFRRSVGLIDDANAGGLYKKIFHAEFDAICPRIYAAGRWVNPQEGPDAT